MPASERTCPRKRCAFRATPNLRRALACVSRIHREFLGAAIIGPRDAEVHLALGGQTDAFLCRCAPGAALLNLLRGGCVRNQDQQVVSEDDAFHFFVDRFERTESFAKTTEIKHGPPFGFKVFEHGLEK
jgi:hypothetical protein